MKSEDKRTFQVCKVDRTGCGSFYYFDVIDSDDNSMKNEVLSYFNQQIDKEKNDYDRFKAFQIFPKQFNLPNIVNVKEYDKNKKCTKRGGLKFRFVRAWITFTYIDGTKQTFMGYDNETGS